MAVATAGLALVLASGCAEMNAVLQPGAISGIMTPRASTMQLAEPADFPTAHPYTADAAARRPTAPVSLDVPDRGLRYSVMCPTINVVGSLHSEGSFEGGKIIEREFANVIAANFREPKEFERPVAQLSVQIQEVKVHQPVSSPDMAAELRIKVDLAKPDGSESACSKDITATASAPWKNRSQVPESFYLALSNTVVQFLAAWSGGAGPNTLALWDGERQEDVVSPELRGIEWLAGGSKGSQRGRCIVDCNDFEGFQAQQWAHVQIEVACRDRLGVTDPERLFLVYDNEMYDKAAGTWTFSFQCRARQEMTLDFDPVTSCGTATADLGLLKMEPDEAAKALRRYVLKEMEAHTGVVSSDKQGSKAFVRFDDYVTDPKFNLITINFRLLR
jgi:hypothetical protein